MNIKSFFESKIIFSMKSKIMYVALLMTFVTSAIIGISIFRFDSKKVENVAETFINEFLKQYSYKVDSSISELDRLSFNIIIDKNIEDLLVGNYANIAEELVMRRDAEMTLRNLENYNNNITGIYIYPYNDREVINNVMSPAIKKGYSIKNETFYKEMVDSKLKFTIVYSDNDPKLLNNPNIATIKFIRDLNAFDSNKKIGIIEIDIKAVLLNLSNEENDKYKIFMLDTNKKFIYIRTDEKKQLEINKSNIISDLNSIENNNTLVNGKTVNSIQDKMLISYYKSNYTNWIFGCVTSLDNLSSEKNSIFYLIMISIIISFAFSLLLAYFAGTKIFNPLEKLRNVMNSVKKNNLDVKITISSHDEIGELSETFNLMLERINHLIETVYKLETQKKEIELEKVILEYDALQSQINPHFLYNTLESISMTAKMNGDTSTQKMVVALGKLLRLSIIRDKKIVPLREEIEHVRSYMDIQMLRFNDKFSIYFDFEETLLDYLTLKLILQPVVENSIYHAIEPKKTKSRIVISGKIEEGKLVIRVMDDGVGMDKDRMNEINEAIKKDSNRVYKIASNIGLSNIAKRINAYFGSDEYGIVIEKSNSAGTVVKITLPLIDGKNGTVEKA